LDQKELDMVSLESARKRWQLEGLVKKGNKLEVEWINSNRFKCPACGATMQRVYGSVGSTNYTCTECGLSFQIDKSKIPVEETHKEPNQPINTTPTADHDGVYVGDGKYLGIDPARIDFKREYVNMPPDVEPEHRGEVKDRIMAAEPVFFTITNLVVVQSRNDLETIIVEQIMSHGFTTAQIANGEIKFEFDAARDVYDVSFQPLVYEFGKSVGMPLKKIVGLDKDVLLHHRNVDVLGVVLQEVSKCYDMSNQKIAIRIMASLQTGCVDIWVYERSEKQSKGTFAQAANKIKTDTRVAADKLAAKSNFIIDPDGKDARLEFGKFKGQKLSEIVKSDRGKQYMDWMLTTSLPEYLKRVVSHQLSLLKSANNYIPPPF